MKQVVIDTETTGLEIKEGHRIIEIGCVELVNRKLTGKTFHRYLNPKRSVDTAAFKIHGITESFLATQPAFEETIDELIEFIKNSELIAHNISFDLGFLNHELKLAGSPLIVEKIAKPLDTLELARKKFPGQQNTLDAICKRYKIDLSERKNKGHGALLDATLLAEAYLLMTRKQNNLFDAIEIDQPSVLARKACQRAINHQLKTVVIKATPEELTTHHNYLKKLTPNLKTTHEPVKP